MIKNKKEEYLIPRNKIKTKKQLLEFEMEMGEKFKIVKK